MEKKVWKRKIKSACVNVGTYRKDFDPVIDTLADILCKRDEAQEQYERAGSNPLVRHVNKANQVNIVQNPLLRIIAEHNRDALAYWRDLGLTPAGLRKINEDALRPKRASPLSAALKDIGGKA